MPSRKLLNLMIKYKLPILTKNPDGSDRGKEASLLRIAGPEVAAANAFLRIIADPGSVRAESGFLDESEKRMGKTGGILCIP